MNYTAEEAIVVKENILDLKLALDQEHDDIDRIKLQNKLARAMYKNSPEEALCYSTEALHLSRTIKFEQGIGDSYNLIGIIRWHQGNFKPAENAFMKSLRVREKIEDATGMAESYNCLGAIYLAYGVYARSLDYFIKSLKMRQKLEQKTELSDCCNNIGLLYEKLGDHEKSLEYHQRSLDIRKELNNQIGIAYSYSNTGNIYKIKGEYDKALDYYFKSLKITQEIEDNYGMAHSYSLVGEIYSTRGDNDEALKYLSKALFIQEKVSDKAGKAISLNRIGEVCARQGAHEEAIDYYDRSLAISKNMNALPLLESVYQNLAQAYSNTSDYKKAFEYQKRHGETRETLFNEEKANAVSQIRSQHEYEKQNQEIERLNSEQTILEEAKSELELFAGKVAHDLKEPLRMMSSFGGLLSDHYGDNLDSNGKEYISIIKNASIHMQALLSDLLEFALSGNAMDEGKQTDLNDTMLLVRNSLRLKIKENQVQLTVPDNLPTVRASSANMEQVFQNLIANAIKFRNKEVNPIIDITCEEQEKHYLLSVKDNGIGINKKYSDEIFQVFSRLHNKKAYEGTGIGLATCKKIVKTLNGKIWVESEIGKGCTFYVQLPR